MFFFAAAIHCTSPHFLFPQNVLIVIFFSFNSSRSRTIAHGSEFIFVVTSNEAQLLLAQGSLAYGRPGNNFRQGSGAVRRL